MTAITYSQPPNRLGKLLSAPGGKKLTQAVADAVANLEEIRPAVLAEVDVMLVRLRDAAERATEGQGVEPARDEVYSAASGVVGFAGVCGLNRLGEVAYNLCELSDRYIEAGVWNAAAIAAHVDTLGLLRAADLPEDSPEGEALLEGLKALVKRAEEQAARTNR